MSLDWTEVVAGTVGGVAVTLVKFPSDTVKTLIQLSKQSGSKMWPVMKRTWKTAGWRGFFRGVAYPLLTVPLVNALVFGAYGQARRWLGHHDPTELTLGQIALCGAWSGLVNCAVVGPIELVKTQMQQQLNQTGSNRFKSMLQVRSKFELRRLNKEKNNNKRKELTLNRFPRMHVLHR
eukprot:TRINITY_DN7046_c0_g3_i1.p1 TRINITY_DN7046_c0_g3~~TRINITY_DN7046_c0_g3_i1.p1  ORF type:complete len:178 (-),score=23.49 TRINITY_DN7046_c0_g3_i1:488-1021(-)